MTWADYSNALVGNGALPATGLALLVLGATFRWYEPLARLLGLLPGTPERAWGGRASRNTGFEQRAAGDGSVTARAEARVEDQRRRLIRYGRAMMLAGVGLLLLSLLV